jgi:Cupin domain
MNASTFAVFEADARAQGFDEALVREWAPGLVIDTHTHPFAVMARVVRGEFWLTVGEDVCHLQAGDPFALARNVPHAERYGDAGATVWVARRHAPASVTSAAPVAG